MRFHIFRPLKKNIHPERWFIIVNPMAGGSRLNAAWPKMEQQLVAAGLVFTFEFTESKGHATKLVQTALENGFKRIAGVGGDGTNNEIINGILNKKNIDLDEIAYTLLPFGTGNDWSRTHKIPRKIQAWVKMILTNRQIKHNVGLLELKKKEGIERRFFINVAGMAYDAHIVKMGEMYAPKSRRKFLYLWLVLRWLWSYNSPRLLVKFNGENREERYYTINCGICRYAGGGMKIVPHANPCSRNIGITLIKDFPKWQVPFDTPKLFTGRLENHRHTEMAQSNCIEIKALENDILEVETDGEYIGSGQVKISLGEKTLNVIVPK